ncbi:hypothetical protein [Rhodanobacter geophilus]|uniref:Thioesterase n=1 Tax=Rhodanobacter geophilus TaxID=3162488 RepID=A0ABV3QN35_9GAMM
MSHYSKPPSGNIVDWSHPDLQLLLSKTEGWSLDNRGVHAPLACELHIGWGAGVGRAATLVYQREGVMVVETRFAIPKGEHVRVDRIQAGAARSSWGIVVDGREGVRAEDRANGVHVHWVHMR